MPRSHRDRRTDAAREQLRTAVPLTALARAQPASARSAPGFAYRPGVDPRQSPEVREHVAEIDRTIREQIEALNGHRDVQRRVREHAELVADGRPDLLVALVGQPVEGGTIALGDWSVPVEVDPDLEHGRVIFVRSDRRAALIDDPDPHGLADAPLTSRAMVTISAPNETPNTDRSSTE